MKFYVLTKTYYKKANPAATMHTNILLFTTKCDIMKARIEAEHLHMLKFFEEVAQETVTTNSKSGNENTDFILNYTYESPNLIGFLTVGVVEHEKLSEEEKTKNIQVGDYATFKPDVYAFFHNPETETSLRRLRNTKIVYVARIDKTKNKADVIVRGETPEQEIGRTASVPLDYLIRLQL